MAIITINYKARCKHCRFAKKDWPIKKDGNMYKRAVVSCSNPESPRYNQRISLKDLVCKKWELF